jgi:hypothetical protein
LTLYSYSPFGLVLCSMKTEVDTEIMPISTYDGTNYQLISLTMLLMTNTSLFPWLWVSVFPYAWLALMFFDLYVHMSPLAFYGISD